ncbi:MAG: TlyA family RNA methyltransferase [Lachnospiraceae bacterium]|nr:TlyA family RNA methyltransferase [Lachnospiraceae bacterium]
MKSSKVRLDVLMTERGLAPSREKAKALIMAGIVYVNDQKEDKAGASFDPQEARIEVRGQTLPYVSRGGLKLEKALKVFPIDLKGRICMDIGASTGGFTDCMLQNGASRVFSIDVGYGQLDWKLRSDERVVCMEKTNFRYVKKEDLEAACPGTPMPDFASVDVSFISLSRILPPAFEILESGGEMVCLIKPQFEAGREKVGKKGVVRDRKVHEEVIETVTAMTAGAGFAILGLDYSPIRGPEGNIEYLMYIRKPGEGEEASPGPVGRETIQKLVAASHESLDRQQA